MNLGDTIIINDGVYNASWIIAAFDPYYNIGWKENDSEYVNKHHFGLIPKYPLFSARMNPTNTSEWGYYGSEMHQKTLPTVADNLKKALGNHLLNRRVLLSNSISTTAASGAGSGWIGCSNNWDWYDAFCTLLTEVQVYGSTVFSSSGYDIGESYEKLPIFNFIHPVTFNRSTFWLRTVSGSTTFAIVAGNGSASYRDTSYPCGVLPLIIIG